MELECLAVGQANAAIDGVSPANLSIACHCLVVITPPGSDSEAASRGAAPASVQHVRRDVAVILLIHAVEADQQEVIALKPPVRPSFKSSAMVPRR